MSELAAATASRTVGRVACTPRTSVAWFGVPLPLPTPTTVMVLPDVEAERVRACTGGALTAAGCGRVMTRTVMDATRVAIKAPRRSVRRFCAVICQLQRRRERAVTDRPREAPP